jgi:hypothetical protein
MTADPIIAVMPAPHGRDAGRPGVSATQLGATAIRAAVERSRKPEKHRSSSGCPARRWVGPCPPSDLVLTSAISRCDDS